MSQTLRYNLFRWGVRNLFVHNVFLSSTALTPTITPFDSYPEGPQMMVSGRPFH